MRSTIASSSSAPGRVLPRDSPPEGLADFARHILRFRQGAVGDVADQVVFPRVGELGELNQRAGIGRHHHADVAIGNRQTHGRVELRVGVADLGDDSRHRVHRADDPLLAGGDQSADVAAGRAARRAEQVVVAAELQDVAAVDAGMRIDRLNAPGLPAAAIVGQEPFGDRDVFRLGGRSAGEREHQQAVLRAQQRIVPSGFHLFDVGTEVFVVGHGHAAAKLRGVPHAVQAVVARKARAGVERQQARGAPGSGRLRQFLAAVRKRRASRRASARGIAPTRARSCLVMRIAEGSQQGATVLPRRGSDLAAAGQRRASGGPARERALKSPRVRRSNRRPRSPDAAVPTSCRQTILPLLRVWRRLRLFRPVHPPFLPPQPAVASAAAVVSASSLVFFFFFLPTAVSTMRTFGRPSGLRPAVQRSSACSTAIRSSRFSTLRARARRPFPLKLLSIVTSRLPSGLAVAQHYADFSRPQCMKFVRKVSTEQKPVAAVSPTGSAGRNESPGAAYAGSGWSSRLP